MLQIKVSRRKVEIELVPSQLSFFPEAILMRHSIDLILTTFLQRNVKADDDDKNGNCISACEGHRLLIRVAPCAKIYQLPVEDLLSARSVHALERPLGTPVRTWKKQGAAAHMSRGGVAPAAVSISGIFMTTISTVVIIYYEQESSQHIARDWKYARGWIGCSLELL